MRRWPGELAAEACKLTHLRKTEEIGDDGLATPVLVGPSGMQTIAAAACFPVDQRQEQIVAAEKPCERPRRLGFPLQIAVCTPRRQAGRDRRGGLQGLLVAGLRRPALGPEAVGAD